MIFNTLFSLVFLFVLACLPWFTHHDVFIGLIRRTFFHLSNCCTDLAVIQFMSLNIPLTDKLSLP